MILGLCLGFNLFIKSFFLKEIRAHLWHFSDESFYDGMFVCTQHFLSLASDAVFVHIHSVGQLNNAWI